MAGVLTGIAWYDRSEWPLLRSLAADPEMLAETYDEWLLGAEQTYARLTAQGYAVEKVEVKLKDLLAWCNSQGRPLDEFARSGFVEAKLRSLDRVRGADVASENAKSDERG